MLFAGERVWVSPWLGVVSVEKARLGGGIGAGVDFCRSPGGHRFGAYLRGFQTEGFKSADDVPMGPGTCASDLRRTRQRCRNSDVEALRS